MVTSFTPTAQLSIIKGTDCYNALNTIFAYFSKPTDIKYQNDFLEFLNLNRTIDSDGSPSYNDRNTLNTLSKDYDSIWYMNWLGDGKTTYSKLDVYSSLVDIVFNDNYAKYFPSFQYISQYLFLKFLNTKIYIFNISDDTYKITGYYPLISELGTPNYTPLQDVLHKFFLKSKGTLNSFLQDYASAITGNVGRDTIASSQIMMSWIGCFSPNLGYQDKSGNMVDAFSGNNKACDPLCYGINKIQLVDENGDNQICNANICVINNLTINVSGEQNITFNQVCPGCANASNNTTNCLCIIDKSIPGVLGKIDGLGNKDNFNQNCPNATCIEYDSTTGILKTVTCQEDNIIINNENEEFTFFGLTKVFPMEVIILSLILIILLLILYKS